VETLLIHQSIGVKRDVALFMISGNEAYKSQEEQKDGDRSPLRAPIYTPTG